MRAYENLRKLFAGGGILFLLAYLFLLSAGTFNPTYAASSDDDKRIWYKLSFDDLQKLCAGTSIPIKGHGGVHDTTVDPVRLGNDGLRCESLGNGQYKIIDIDSEAEVDGVSVTANGHLVYQVPKESLGQHTWDTKVTISGHDIPFKFRFRGNINSVSFRDALRQAIIDALPTGWKVDKATGKIFDDKGNDTGITIEQLIDQWIKDHADDGSTSTSSSTTKTTHRKGSGNGGRNGNSDDELWINDDGSTNSGGDSSSTSTTTKGRHNGSGNGSDDGSLSSDETTTTKGRHSGGDNGDSTSTTSTTRRSQGGSDDGSGSDSNGYVSHWRKFNGSGNFNAKIQVSGDFGNAVDSILARAGFNVPGKGGLGTDRTQLDVIIQQLKNQNPGGFSAVIQFLNDLKAGNVPNDKLSAQLLWIKTNLPNVYAALIKAFPQLASMLEGGAQPGDVNATNFQVQFKGSFGPLVNSILQKAGFLPQGQDAPGRSGPAGVNNGAQGSSPSVNINVAYQSGYEPRIVEFSTVDKDGNPIKVKKLQIYIVQPDGSLKDFYLDVDGKVAKGSGFTFQLQDNGQWLAVGGSGPAPATTQPSAPTTNPSVPSVDINISMLIAQVGTTLDNIQSVASDPTAYYDSVLLMGSRSNGSRFNVPLQLGKNIPAGVSDVAEQLGAETTKAYKAKAASGTTAANAYK